MATSQTKELTRPQLFTLMIRYIPGLVLTGVITGLALNVGDMPWFINMGLGALTLAILFGIIVGNTLYPWLQPVCSDGVVYAKQYLLRLGIILYGFRLTFQQVADVGATGMVIDLLTLSSTFILACWLGKRVFGLDQQTVMLIGAGSSICGAAAIMATEPVLKADASKVAVAVATVVIFGTLAIFVYPWLYQLNLHYQWLPFSQETFGILRVRPFMKWLRSSLPDMPLALMLKNAAVITKMIRVMMLAPFLLLLSAYLGRSRIKQAVKNARKALSPSVVCGDIHSDGGF